MAYPTAVTQAVCAIRTICVRTVRHAILHRRTHCCWFCRRRWIQTSSCDDWRYPTVRGRKISSQLNIRCLFSGQLWLLSPISQPSTKSGVWIKYKYITGTSYMRGGVPYHTYYGHLILYLAALSLISSCDNKKGWKSYFLLQSLGLDHLTVRLWGWGEMWKNLALRKSDP